MSSAARAFEQRSAAAVAQVIAELDNAASAPDTPEAASPAVDGAGSLDFRGAQIEEDAKLAEQLQREEYQKEEARVQRQRERRAAAAAEQNMSWTEWLMGTTPSTSSAGPQSSASSGGARVAQPSGSIFACVAQSIGSAMGPAHEQVRGVDSSSLL
ncbi:unnamed protein product [Pseudo-nitzschia multistriata]|uniref:Uncharacterized protein n=1 Tax=Pseudo-nitzschia multistriata TaxID=183589 RepID=A0A448ZSM9_9STRA|nr:unnamed protein product [Pseudo-nitzschia multistriata]